MPDASFADVTDRYTGPLVLDPAKTETLIGDAGVVLRSPQYVPDLDARLADGRTSAAAVRIVVVRMVLRVLRNPEGFKNEQAGDYGYSVDTAVASGRLFLTADDLALLGLGSRSRRLGTMKIGSDYRARSL